MHEDSRPHYTTAPPTASKLSIRSFAAWGLVAVTSVIALTGAYYWGASNAAITEIEIVIPTPEPAVVQVVGEVRAPGVYELNLDARVLDAIDAAGGMTENAAIESINLAATVKDGSRILVPVIPSATPTSIAEFRCGTLIRAPMQPIPAFRHPVMHYRQNRQVTQSTSTRQPLIS